MCKMLLSIKPEHVNNIFKGIKQYEYRKIRCREQIDKIIIYATYPVMSIVGEADVENILEGSPDSVWQKTYDLSGISKNFYDQYYKGHKKAIAYKLANIEKYTNPKPLESFGIHSAPQSFMYIT